MRDENNVPLPRASGLGDRVRVEIEFADGRVSAITGAGAPDAQAASVSEPEVPLKADAAKKPVAKKKKTRNPPEQGSLF